MSAGDNELTCEWLVNGGELGERIRAAEWEKTELGPRSEWPLSLRFALTTCLSSSTPLSVLWGPKLRQFYNDAYRDILGKKHPDAIGQPLRQTWAEQWDVLGTPCIQAINEERSILMRDQRVFTQRKDFTEEAYFTNAFCPIWRRDGTIGGILHTCVEKTDDILAHRRMRTLRDLLAREVGARSPEAAAKRIVEVIDENAFDIPFSLIYRFEPDYRTATLMATSGLPVDSAARPPVVDLRSPDHVWSLSEVTRTDNAISIEHPFARFRDLHIGPWPENPPAARVYPLSGNSQFRGAVVLGVSARLPFDENHRQFLNQAASQIAGSLADVAFLQQEREKSLSCQVLVESSALAVWEVDASGGIIEDSPEWRAFTGQSKEDWLGGRWIEAVHPDDRARVGEWSRRSLENKRPSEIQYRLLRADDAWRWTQVRVAPFWNQDGTIRKWIGMNFDITEQKQAEHALKEADERKDHFLATLGHELRNPLAAISMAVAIARSDTGGTRREWTDQVIERQVVSLRRLVDDLLEVSRITRGKIELKRDCLNLGREMLTAVESIQPEISARRQRLSVRGPSMPTWIEADPVRLQQILLNLLGNAAKYTPDGGVIEFTVEPRPAHVLVRCKDSGVGIPTESLNLIFEPFVQLDTELHRGGAGLGIGLALVKHLVEMHGGTISAYSAGVGHGSEFILQLPVVDPPADAEIPHSPEYDGSANRKSRRVLIAEDNVDFAETLRAVLETAGHDVRLCHDGVACLEAARTQRPEVMLIDIGLPGQDGYAVAEAARGMPGLQKTTLIGMSGYRAESSPRIKVFDRYLIKPLAPDELLQLI